MLLLIPSGFKLVNYFRPSESEECLNSDNTAFSMENGAEAAILRILKTHRDSKDRPIQTQKVPKEA